LAEHGLKLKDNSGVRKAFKVEPDLRNESISGFGQKPRISIHPD
jgi:hypothetical protein